MLLSDIDPILIEWIDYFIPLFSRIAKLLILGTMLILMQIVNNIFSKLIVHISKA